MRDLSGARGFDNWVSMKPRRAAAIALVGWYLMVPPVRQPMYVEGHADYSEWKVLRVFPDYYKCEFYLVQVKQLLEEAHGQEIDAECFASDDPHMKGIVVKHPPN